MTACFLFSILCAVVVLQPHGIAAGRPCNITVFHDMSAKFVFPVEKGPNCTVDYSSMGQVLVDEEENRMDVVLDHTNQHIYVTRCLREVTLRQECPYSAHGSVVIICKSDCIPNVVEAARNDGWQTAVSVAAVAFVLIVAGALCYTRKKRCWSCPGTYTVPQETVHFDPQGNHEADAIADV